jgi:hypothetical protein
MTAFAKSCGGYRSQARGAQNEAYDPLRVSAQHTAGDFDNRHVEIVCAASARVNVSVLYQFVDTANRTWPTWRGSAAGISGRAARGSVAPERWPAVRPRGQEALAVQGHRLALGGQPGRCPFTRPLDFSEHQDAWTERHCRPLCRELINRM